MSFCADHEDIVSICLTVVSRLLNNYEVCFYISRLSLNNWESCWDVEHMTVEAINTSCVRLFRIYTDCALIDTGYRYLNLKIISKFRLSEELVFP